MTEGSEHTACGVCVCVCPPFGVWFYLKTGSLIGLELTKQAPLAGQ